MTPKKLRQKYVALMERADNCTSRKEALSLIHEATKIIEMIKH